MGKEQHIAALESIEGGVLHEIYRWMKSWIRMTSGLAVDLPSDVRSVESEMAKVPRIFWINGFAGTGKTTIAHSVAQKCKDRRILGASFFCSRDDINASDPKLVFTSISDQLGQFHAPFQQEISRVHHAHPGLRYSSVSNQLEELLVKPLNVVRDNFPHCVIILDALDECRDDNSTSIILSSLSRHIDTLAPLKFLVTGRPETRIIHGFRLPKLRPATERLDLHEVKLEVVEHDIEYFLTVRLGDVRLQFGVSDLWPATQDVQALTRLSAGLFIFASTAVKFIEDPKYSDPKGQLAVLLENVIINEDSSPHRRLDLLYMQVLTTAFPDISTDLSERLKNILGTIALAQYPLALADIGQLLNLDVDIIRSSLLYLGSVLSIPETNNDRIRFIHPSFFDFILDPTRCTDLRFVVDPQTQHALLTEGCLQIMKALKRDICKIGSPSKLDIEVEDLVDRIAQHIPPYLQYACRNWHYHLSHCPLSDALLELFREFCSHSLLHWVEVCSLLGDFRNAIIGLDAVCQLVLVRVFHLTQKYTESFAYSQFQLHLIFIHC
jgi:hypothetical protein